MSVFEIFMLLCFGFAWPIAILKSIRSKSIEGKSLIFIYVILFGYVFGMLHKIIYSLDFVIILYFINFCMVFIDLMLYYRNRRNRKEVI
jgi:lipopolysaccharide export LptBFGC system permease protein LptF